MATPSIREPHARLTWPFGKASTDFLVLNWAVGAHPTILFNAYTGKNASQGANQALDSQISSRMGEIQTKMFAARTDPDVNAELEDGAGNSLSFRGFITGPSFVRDKRTYRPGAAAIGEAAIISNLKLDIYTTNSGREDPEQPLVKAVGIITRTSASWSLATRLKELTQQLIKFWNAQKQEVEPSATTLAIKSTRHNINMKGPLQAWFKLLDNSVGELLLPWLEVVAKENATSENFNLGLIQILLQSTQDFMETIQYLCDTFQLIMIPALDGTPGKLVPRHKTVTGEAKRLVVPDKSILLSGVNNGAIMPVQQVIVRGMPTEIVGIPATMQGAYEKDGRVLLGAYPEEAPAETGNIPFVDLPMELQMMLKAEGFGTGGPAGDSPPSMSEAVQGFRRVRRHLAKRTNAIAQKIIDDFGKSKYVELALGGSSATVVIPLDFKIEPGYRYSVVNSRGEHLFDGFMAGMTHQMEKQVGGVSDNISTTLNFSHITFGDFKLPGL